MKFPLIPLLTFFFLAATAAGQEVSFDSLLREMTDTTAVARYPQPAFLGRQASSYDRDSISPDEPGWFANADRSQFVRTEEFDGRTEHVMLDVQGPGALVRFWATWHGPGGGEFSNGTLRIYLDGQKQPAIAGPMADLISGGALVGEPFSESVAPDTDYARRGHNLYLPIPYAKSCRVTYETSVLVDRGGLKGEALYYQINHRVYEQGTKVRTFRMQDLDHYAELLRATGADLQGLLLHERGPDFEYPVRTAMQLEPGASETYSLQGSRVIERLAIFLTDEEDHDDSLRSCVVEIVFDGERTVWCPLGELIGSGPAARNVTTWRTVAKHSPSAFLAFTEWPMPFEKSAAITLHNFGTKTLGLAIAVGHSPWQWDDRSMHFHAAWHQLDAVDTGGNKDFSGTGAFDVNYVTLEGEGVYVGDTLSLFNGGNTWWGEGDEKIWVDGETFPSHFGTGTEDYYGYAWCRPEVFASPWHSQPCGDGNLQSGATTNSRYRILDTIPFRQRLQVDMELWHWVGTRIDYAPATFWYARPGGRCNITPNPQAAARKVSRQRSDVVEIFKLADAVEGEAMTILMAGGGRAEVQDASNYAWSGEQQLWWMDGAIGDQLELGFQVPKPGRYRVIARLTQANDYAQVRMSLNGQAAGEWDRYNPAVETTELDLGTFELRAKDNRLTIEIVGRNEAAVARNMFGLDALRITAVL